MSTTPGRSRRRARVLSDDERFILEFFKGETHHRDIQVADLKDLHPSFGEHLIDLDGVVEFFEYKGAVIVGRALLKEYDLAGIERPSLRIRIVQGGDVVDSIELPAE